MDPLQNIYGKDTEVAQALLEEAGFGYYQVEENCRNSREVAIQASIISGMDLALEGAIPGPACDCVFYRNRDDFVSKLESVIADLRAHDVALEDMIILSTRKLENSLLGGRKSIGDAEIVDIARLESNVPGMHFATMHSFKGLERKVVLAIDLDRIADDSFAMLYYAGLSRARGLLRPFVAEADRHLYELQAKRYGERVATGKVQ
jgi:hypothetical protein